MYGWYHLHREEKRWRRRTAIRTVADGSVCDRAAVRRVGQLRQIHLGAAAAAEQANRVKVGERNLGVHGVDGRGDGVDGRCAAWDTRAELLASLAHERVLHGQRTRRLGWHTRMRQWRSQERVAGRPA
jgi:hypothetical protein